MSRIPRRCAEVIVGAVLFTSLIAGIELAPLPPLLRAGGRMLVLGMGFAISIFLLHRMTALPGDREAKPWVRRIGFVVLGLVFVESSSLALLDFLFTRKPDLQRLYNVAFNVRPDYIGPALTLNYARHHYLNYALNPRTPYMGSPQYNEQFLIRRTEPIRPREDVAWRGLVLGGSTAFGEKVANESDTWVHQLEQRIRAKWGTDHDVINGGVGGYTLVENMIHYMTLLTELDPDVVFLYEGINDVHPRLYAGVNSDYSGYRVPWRRTGSVFPDANGQLGISATYRFCFTMTRLLPIQLGGIHESVSDTYPPSRIWKQRLAENPPTIYQSHLRNFVRYLKSEGKQVVIIPQYFDPRKKTDEIFALGVQQNNEANRTVAYEESVGWVDAITKNNSFDREDTFDNCHFNEQGSARMAHLLADYLFEHAASNGDRLVLDSMNQPATARAIQSPGRTPSPRDLR